MENFATTLANFAASPSFETRYRSSDEVVRKEVTSS